MSKEKTHKFTAILEKPDDGMDTAYVSFPYDVEELYGTKGQVKVRASFDGQPYRGVLVNMGTGCHIIGVRKDIRTAIKKQAGDTVEVEITRDTEERIVDMPKALIHALKKAPKAEAFYNTLSFTNRKEYAVWISSAKKEETRDKRLSETLKKLLAGKKNQSEK